MNKLIFVIMVCMVLAALLQWGPKILNDTFRILSSQRGSVIGGRLAKVMYGSVVVAGIGNWSMSGFVPKLDDSTAFGDTVATYKEAGIGDPGTISFSGFYDDADPTGQAALQALANTGAELTNLYFYTKTNQFFRVGSGGSIILDKFNSIKMDKNALGTVEFSGRVSGKLMERVG